MKRFGWLGAATLLGLSLCASPARGADAPDGLEQARTLFREAAAAEQSGNWTVAVEKYQASLALKQSALTLHHLAVAQRESGALVAALRTFRLFLEAPQSDKSRVYLDDARAEIERLERRVAKLIVRLPAAVVGVSATIDDQPVSGGAQEPLDPGEHTVRVTAVGRAPFERRLTLREGEASEITVELPSEPRAAETPARDAPGPRPMVLPIALMSTGGLVALVGASVGVAGFVSADGVAADSDRAARLREMGIAADVLIPTGAVAAGVGLLLAFVLPPSKPQREPQAASLWLGPSSVGAELRF